MCRTILTVVHHTCQPEHITRQTRTEQCYGAYFLRVPVCAPGPPRHSFYEQHLPGAACQSCFYAHNTAYNSNYDSGAGDNEDDAYDIDPATLNNQRLLFGRQPTTPNYPPPYVPHPPSLLPAPVNPPYFGTGEHTHEQIPYAGPAIPTGVPGVHIDRPLIDTFAPRPSPDDSSGTHSPRMGHLRGGGGGGGDGDKIPPSSGSPTPANTNNDNDNDNDAGEETENEENRQLREALERSLLERERDEEADVRRAAEQSAREFAELDADDVRRVAGDSLREYADAERAALVRAMRESAAEAEGQRARSEEREEREVLRRSVATWREEVLRRMGQWDEQGRGGGGGGGAGCEDDGGGGQGGRDEVRRGETAGNWAGRDVVVPYGDAKRSESMTAQSGHSTPEASTSSEQDQTFQGMGSQGPYADFDPPVLEQHPYHAPAQRSTCHQPPTVEDDMSEPKGPATWSFERVAQESQEQGDDTSSTIMDPAAEVSRAMDAVDMSRDPAAYIRKKRLARSAERSEEQ
ncbi:hypothetical protein SLS55_006941 [Diplodia seriata]|uniref:Uncharacterized protein n=1 Tax=Diplodia seriata TaxID=420778 RepID=A0ABR3CAX0_9PEZI